MLVFEVFSSGGCQAGQGKRSRVCRSRVPPPGSGPPAGRFRRGRGNRSRVTVRGTVRRFRRRSVPCWCRCFRLDQLPGQGKRSRVFPLEGKRSRFCHLSVPSLESAPATLGYGGRGTVRRFRPNLAVRRLRPRRCGQAPGWSWETVRFFPSTAAGNRSRVSLPVPGSRPEGGGTVRRFPSSLRFRVSTRTLTFADSCSSVGVATNRYRAAGRGKRPRMRSRR